MDTIEKNGSVNPKPPKPAKPKTYSETIKERLKDARQGELKDISKESQDVVSHVMEIVAKQYDLCNYPDVADDLTIKMELMRGGTLTLVPPTGYHAMAASRLMKLSNEKGDEETMYPAYLMAACADLGGEMASIAELQEKMTARDFNTALTFFRRINLI
jgi:hypothetical protein